MTSFSALIRPENVATGFQGIEVDPTGFTDVISAGFYMTRDNYNTNSASRLVGDIRDEIQGQMRSHGFESRFDELYQSALTPERKRKIQDFQMVKLPEKVKEVEDEAYDEAVLKGRAENPDFWNNVKTSEEIREEARNRANLSREEFERVSRGADGFDRTVGGFLGTMGGAATDPLNIGTMFLGAGAHRTLLQTVAIEAALNAGVELAAQPAVAEWQKELGQEYGFSDVALNVMAAGVLGGGFAGVMKAAKPTARMVLDSIAGNEKLPMSVRNAARDLSAFTHLKEANPAPARTLEDDALHFENIMNAARALDEGRPLTPDEIYISALNPVDKTGKGFFDLPDTIPADVKSELATARLAEVERIQAELIADKDQAISKKERKQLRQELQQLKRMIDGGDQEIEPTIGGRVRQPEDSKRLAAEERQAFQERADAIEQKLQASKVGEEAEADLSRIEQGLIPERFRDRLRLVDANILAGVDTSAKRLPADVETKVQQDLLDAGVMDPPRAEVAVQMEMLKRSQSDDAVKSAEVELNRMLEENEDMILTIGDDRFTLRQIAKEFNLDEQEIEAVGNCAVGGGK